MTTETLIERDVPIVCQLLEPELREREQVLQQELFSGVEAIRELSDGYALRYPGEVRWLATLTEFIRFERDCCPFLRFELHAEPQHGPLWLELRGQAGVKEFVEAVLLPQVPTIPSSR